MHLPYVIMVPDTRLPLQGEKTSRVKLRYDGHSVLMVLNEQEYIVSVLQMIEKPIR